VPQGVSYVDFTAASGSPPHFDHEGHEEHEESGGDLRSERMVRFKRRFRQGALNSTWIVI